MVVKWDISFLVLTRVHAVCGFADSAEFANAHMAFSVEFSGDETRKAARPVWRSRLSRGGMMWVGGGFGSGGGSGVVGGRSG